MYEIKRKEKKTLEVKLGDDILHAELEDSLKRYREYMKSLHKMQIMQAKIDEIKKTNEIGEEVYELYGECVMALLRNVFPASDVDKIIAFFENDAEEALSQLMPFIMGEYLAALTEERKQRSKEKIEAL